MNEIAEWTTLARDLFGLGKLRHEDMLARTNRLRELRLAREVALRAAKAVVKAKLPK
jgi:hypothetical protein